MENRFSVKDFFLFGLMIALIIVVVLAMVQFDRQYDNIRDLRQDNTALATDLSQIRNGLRDLDESLTELRESGIAFSPGGGVDGNGTANLIERGVGRTGESDPFYQLKEVETDSQFARGGWFRDGFGTKIGRLTPFVSGDVYQNWVELLVMETLATRDPYTLEFLPRLARGWQISEDGLEMTFKLRKGVNFSDGQPLDADDVIFTFDWIKNPEVQADRVRSFLTTVEKVEKVDELTVKFTFNEPKFNNFESVAGVPILAEHFYEQYTPGQFNEHVALMLGSGPYKLEAGPDGWTPTGEGVVLVRNERYWGTPGTFERMIFDEVQEDVARMVNYTNQDVDILRVNPEQYTTLRNDESAQEFTNYIEYTSAYSGYLYIGWNQAVRTEGRDPEPTKFADERVRQAMTLMLDRDRMAEELFLGYAQTASGPFIPSNPQSNPDIEPWPYDPERGREILAELGWEDRDGDGVIEDEQGNPFRFKLIYPGTSDLWEKIVLFMRDNFARGGVIMEPERLDWPVLVDRLNAGNFEAITLGWSSTVESDPYQIFHSSQAAGQGDNRTNYANPELDALIDEARTTIDRDARMKLWNEVHAVLHEDQPYTFLFFRQQLRAVNQRVQGVDKSTVGLNWEPLNSGIIPWFIPQGQQRFAE
ncbi:MAG: peptide-binding protein [Planctomycetota bacterium]